MASDPTPSLLLTGQTVQKMIGVSRVTLWRLSKAGEFPQAIRVGTRAVRWRADEIEAWISSRPRATGATAAA